MIVDTSALACVFLQEPGFARFDRAIADRTLVLIPVACFVEFSLLRGLGPRRMIWLEALAGRDAVKIAGLDVEERALAVSAAQKYGKGSGHPARLNFGDCLVYAAAKSREMPLLFKGDDFIHTDIVPALETGS